MSSTTYSSLYNEHRSELLVYARFCCGCEATAKDIVQNSFLRLLERKVPLQEIQNWKAYLFVLVRNETINYLRGQQRQLRLRGQISSLLQVDLQQKFLEKEYRQVLGAAIKRLPAKCRQVYQLNFELGYDNKKIAKELCLSVNTIKCQLKKARSEVREYVKQKLAA